MTRFWGESSTLLLSVAAAGLPLVRIWAYMFVCVAVFFLFFGYLRVQCFLGRTERPECHTHTGQVPRPLKGLSHFICLRTVDHLSILPGRLIFVADIADRSRISAWARKQWGARGRTSSFILFFIFSYYFEPMAFTTIARFVWIWIVNVCVYSSVFCTVCFKHIVKH